MKSLADMKINYRIMNNDQSIIDAIGTDVTLVIEKLKEVELINDATGEARASEYKALVQKEIKRIEAMRVAQTKPINDHLKWLNNGFRSVTDPLDQALSQITRAMIAYRNSVEFKAKEAQRIEAENQARQAIKEGDTVKLAEVANDSSFNEAPRAVATATGKTSYRKQLSWEIEDEAKIPRNFFILNEKMINTATKAGIKIEGIKVIETMVPVTRLS